MLDSSKLLLADGLFFEESKAVELFAELGRLIGYPNAARCFAKMFPDPIMMIPYHGRE